MKDIKISDDIYVARFKLWILSYCETLSIFKANQVLESFDKTFKINLNK